MKTVVRESVASVQRVVLSIACLGALALPAAAGTVSLSINYTDAPGTGFNAAGAVGAERKSAMNYAMSKYAGLFEAQYAGEEVRINASFTSTSFLGYAGPEFFFNGPFPLAETWYASPLANHIFGTDIQNDFGFGPFNGPHVSMQFGDWLIDGAGPEFYFGIDGATPGGRYDFATVAIHEVMHGLGMLSLVTSSGAFNGLGFTVDWPHIYDQFVFDPVSGKTLAEMTVAERSAAIRSGNLVWKGPNATAANGGTMPSLYNPAGYAQGSSISHWDEGTYPSEVMTPFLGFGESIHSFSPMTLGALQDIGWNMAVAVPLPDPGLLTIVGMAMIAVVSRRRRKRAA